MSTYRFPSSTLGDAILGFFGALARIFAIACWFAFILGMFVLVTGCGPARVVVKTQTVDRPVYVYKPLPDELTRACVVTPLEPACTRNGKPELCNDQLLFERNAYRTELRGCDIDKTEIRKLQPPTTGANH